MPPSQLKRLKASLREQGITGPQKSTKKKNAQPKNRQAALETIRESLNPFGIKTLARPHKREVTTAQTLNSKPKNAVLGRPGVTKSLGEERRRRTLLAEIQKRNKTGGIIDRRIGESDPTLTAEDRAIQRYTRERLSRKGASVFDLEGVDDEVLTHGGKKLRLHGQLENGDDFDAGSLGSASEDEGKEEEIKAQKGKRIIEELVLNEEEDYEEPQRKKSKAEVMREVIAKSKLHKYERQAAKEEDDALRDELDAELSGVMQVLNGFKGVIEAREQKLKAEQNNSKAADLFHMNPERFNRMNGLASENADKAYDQQIRQMIHDKRSKPTDRTKTEDELEKEKTEKERALEESRQKRMRGEEDDNNDENEKTPKELSEDDDHNDAAEFGLGGQNHGVHSRPDGVDDEDDFLLEDDLIAQDSDLDSSTSDLESLEPDLQRDDMLFSDDTSGTPNETSKATATSCPRTLNELKLFFANVPPEQYNERIRQVRLQHDVSLHESNHSKLSDLAVALVEFLPVIPTLPSPLPPATIDSIIRHIHSLSRKHSLAISTAFRAHLAQSIRSDQHPTTSALVVLTAISTIFPTSDRFHPVATPAMTLIARWLGLSQPKTRADLTRGAYLVALALKFQALTKRYVPEALRFTLLVLETPHPPAPLDAHIKNLSHMASLWSQSPAFIEAFSPRASTALQALAQEHPSAQKAYQHLTILLAQARLARRPLELHHHRPIPIKSSIPRFETCFDPTKHYDPDAERAEGARLRKEYRRERKGVMRELRRDAAFVAREKLREKRERDRVYEEKQRRLIAEIQGEEGREKNAYEREKRLRRGKR